MLYSGYDSYGYTEPQAFTTVAEQKGIEFNDVKYVDETVLDNDSFYTEGGQQLTDLVTPKN